MQHTLTAHTNPKTITKEIIPVKGMHCASCASTIKRTVGKVDGVELCEVNPATEKATLMYDSSKTSVKELSETIKPFGYEFETNEPAVPMQHMDHSNMQHKHAQPKQSSEHTGVHDHKDMEESEQRFTSRVIFPLTLVVFAVMLWEIAASALPTVIPFPIPMRIHHTIIFFIASYFMFFPGKRYLQAIVRFFKTGVANMDSLVGIGTLAAYVYSTALYTFPELIESFQFPETLYFDATIVVIGFITYGKYLEAKSKKKTGEALEQLMHLQAKDAFVIRDGEEVRVPIEQVVVGDLLVVKPGSTIPVDGVLTQGNSYVDESIITGEPLPVSKKPGDLVTGGTINKQGAFQFKATKVGKDTMLAQIVTMVDQAQNSRAPIEKLTDQISAVFVPAALLFAEFVFLLWLIFGPMFLPFSQAFVLGLTSFIGVLVIACPCALGLATPTAVVAGVGRGARAGILIKDAESLEKMHDIDTVVFDKTGTITEGKPAVTDILTEKGESESAVLQLVASLEKQSEHPLAQAVLEKAKQQQLPTYTVEDFEAVEGKGVLGVINQHEYAAGNLVFMNQLGIQVQPETYEQYVRQGKTPILFASHAKLKGIIFVADTIKPVAKEAIRALHNMKLHTVMLTGDNKHTAEYIAKQAGIDEVIAEVLPQDKSQYVDSLQKQGKKVAMVGDGVNDAPALATAHVGIAMSTGTDIAMSTADMTLLHGDIKKVVDAIKLSRKTMRIVKQNLFWAFFYNLITIPVAAGALYPFFGILLNPAFAGMAMAFSSVSVVANSLRLRGAKL